MPRATRESDEDVETKSSVRRTRATTALVTDSPVRRSTRSNKHTVIAESSPESIDDGNAKSTARTTRSRAATATLDKNAIVNTGRNLRSRKNSASSDQSELIDVEFEANQKKVTKKIMAPVSAAGTPTKSNIRTRNVRAGSEAKSTPPATRSKRATRASSMDPVSLNESLGTPIKRRTRASIVLLQPVTEEKKDTSKACKSLENSAIDINETDSECITTLHEEKSNDKSLNNKNEIKNYASNDKEIISDAEKTLESSNKIKESITDESYAGGETASSPEKLQQISKVTQKTSSKRLSKDQKKDVQKNNVTINDSEDDTENLFQDIPAEEWSQQMLKHKDESNQSVNISNTSNSEECNGNNNLKKTRSNNIPNNKNDTIKSSKNVRNSFSAEENNSSIKISEESEESETEKSNQILKNLNVKNDNNENKSCNSSRSETNTSIKLNQSTSETSNSNSKQTRRSSNQSLNKLNQSALEQNQNTSRALSTSLNNSKEFKRESLSSKDKSKQEHSFIEAMEVDDVDAYNETEKSKLISPNKINKSPVKTQMNQSVSKSVSTPEKLSSSMNNSKIKRLSMDKYTNTSSRKSLTEQVIENNENTLENSNDENLNNDQESLDKRNSLNKCNKSGLEQTKNISLKEKLAYLCSSDDEELETDKNKALNRSSRLSIQNNPSMSEEADASLKMRDKSLKEVSLRKSLNKSASKSDFLVDSPSKTDNKENEKKIFKKSDNNKPFIKDLTLENIEGMNKSVSELSPDEIEVHFNKTDHLDKSLQKSIERMKYANPSKHDYSTIAQVDSNSESSDDDEKIPCFLFANTDSDENKDSDEESEDNANNKSIDSDIAKEYNLAGKDKIKYSDDDLPGDDCLQSEDESSDSEDDGADLDDFVIPDDEVEASASESEDDNGSVSGEEDQDGDQGSDETNGGDSDENNVNEELESVDSTTDDEEVLNVIETKSGSNKSKNEYELKNNSKLAKDKSFNLSKSMKDTSTNSSKSIKNNSVCNNSKSVKNKGGNDCKLLSNTTSDAEVTKEIEPMEQLNANSTNVSKNANNKSIKDSKSLNNKSKNLSKSDMSNVSKSIKRKSVIIQEPLNNDSTSNSEDNQSDDDDATNEIASPSESESKSESAEDSYHILTVDPSDPSKTQPLIAANKNRALIESSTPKIGFDKKNNFSKMSFVDKSNLSVATRKSTGSTRRSGSLNDLSNTKSLTKRLNVDTTNNHDNTLQLKDDVEIRLVPIHENRQAWKLIPLNRTVHVDNAETPTTKYLKKSKLNDSVPILKSMKSGESPDTNESKANKKRQSLSKSLQEKTIYVEEVADEPLNVIQTKKRKLQDLSQVASIDEDSLIKVAKKKKKRARIDESTDQDMLSTVTLQEDNREQTSHEKKKKKKKKSAEMETQQVEEVVELSKKCKKKKGKAKSEVDKNSEESQITEEKTKKKKKKKSHESSEPEVPLEVTKPKKKKSRHFDEQYDQENLNLETLKTCKKSKSSLESECSKEKKTKRKKHSNEVSENDLPNVSAFEIARRTLSALQQEVENARALKSKNKKLPKVQKASKPVSMKRLPEELLETLTDLPAQRPIKRQKLAKDRERITTLPSKSMFSPGKLAPANLKVDDGFIPLSDTGSTTQFGVVNLQKAKKAMSKSAVVLSFREKMLARNQRQPMQTYQMYQKKQKSKSGL